jgi:hypothetical protein
MKLRDDGSRSDVRDMAKEIRRPHGKPRSTDVHTYVVYVGDHALGAIGGRGVKHGLASLGLFVPGTAVFSSF